MKPTKPGVYLLDGKPAIVGIVKGTLWAYWLTDSGEVTRARVWSKELVGAEWRESK